MRSKGIMAEMNECGNQFLLELKSALRKFNRSHAVDNDEEKVEGMNNKDTLTAGDTTCTYSLNETKTSSTLNLNGDVTIDGEKLNNDDSAVIAINAEPKGKGHQCDHKTPPCMALYNSKLTQKGLADVKHLQQNGRLPGILVDSKLVHSGLKLQVSDVETPEGSNASSPKTMSTVYSSDKESTIQIQRTGPKTPSPAPWSITETDLPCTSQRASMDRNMKVVHADLYNELNSVLKKRNEMTRRSSILELERQKGCKTIVYYGRGGAASGRLIRNGSVTSGSPSSLAAARTRKESVTSKTDLLRSDSVTIVVETPLPPCGTVHSKQKEGCLNRPDPLDIPKCKLQEGQTLTKPGAIQGHRGKPELPWVPPPTLETYGGKRTASACNTTDSNRLLRQTPDHELHALDHLSGSHKSVYRNVSPASNCVEMSQASDSNKLITDLTQSQHCVYEHVSNSESSETNIVVSKELIDLRKAFDTLDAKNVVSRNYTDVQKETNKDHTDGQSVNTSEPEITVEIQWPKDPPSSYLYDELCRWHERLSGKWKNQDEDDMLDDTRASYSDGDEDTLRLPDGEALLDRDNIRSASQSSMEAAHIPTSHIHLPRAGLSQSTRQRLRDIKQTAAAKLFAKAEEHNDARPNVEETKPIEKHNLRPTHQDDVVSKQSKNNGTEEEEKESSIDFTEEVHPGSLVSQLVDRMRAYKVDTPMARVYCDDSMPGEISDASCKLTADKSLLPSGSKYHGGTRQPHENTANLPVTSDLPLTSVTSYDVLLEDQDNDRYRLPGLSSNKTLAFTPRLGTSAADMKCTSGSSIKQQSQLCHGMTSQNSVTDIEDSFVKSSNTVSNSEPPNQLPGSKLGSTTEYKESVVPSYAESGKPEGPRHFVQSDKTVFVEVIPTTYSVHPSRGFADEKVNSLDRFSIRRCRNVVQCSTNAELENGGRTSDGGNGHTNYATYPPPSRPYTPEDDMLTNLMITHSGDPLPQLRRTSLDEGKRIVDKKHNYISGNVTVPQPTSFHSHGNNVGGHLINPPCARGKLGMPVDSDGVQVRSSFTDYESGADNHVDPCPIPCPLSNKVNDSGSGEESRHLFQRKHVTVLDKESQRHLLFQTWSTNAAKKARGRSRLPHWRRGARNTHTDDSDTSVGHGYSACERRKQHHSDHELSDSGGSSRSMVKSRLLHYSDSFSSCDAPCGEMGIYHQKRDRTFTGVDSVHSACTFVADPQEHSSDGDTESLYQDYEQYEQSLIQYVRTEDLSQINEDIRSLYWQQFDSTSLPGLSGHRKGILHRLVCCFFCEHNHRTSFPNRVTSRASSSKIF